MSLPEEVSKPKGLLWGWIFSLLGFGASVYSLIHHFAVHSEGQTDALCNINGFFNCDQAALSEYSEIFQIPLGVYGAGYFAAFAVLLFYHRKLMAIGSSLLLWAGVGLLTSFGLFFLSVTKLSGLCPTCIAVYVSCVGIFAFAFFHFKREKKFQLAILDHFRAFPAVLCALLIFKIVGTEEKLPQPKTLSEQQKQLALGSDSYEIPVSTSRYSKLGEDFRAGNDEAKVVIVEFADFECPACRQSALSMSAMKKEFGDQILVVFKNFPLDNKCHTSLSSAIHPNACEIAKLARCAGRYGAFWQFHDFAFANQGSFKRDDWAKTVGLSEKQVESCLADETILKKIQADIQLGANIGVTGTPSIYINGHKYLGNRGDLRAFIADKLKL